MTEYIYIVKCDGCEDEIFNFFTDARMQCDLVMSKHPIIQQIEIERNDFGECIDSCDLGTVWSWEDVMGKKTDAEPAIKVFNKGYFANYNPDNDPEFAAFDNTLTEADDKEDPNDERRKAQTQSGYDAKKAPSDAAVGARDNDLENRSSNISRGYNSHGTVSQADVSTRDNDVENRASKTQLGYDPHKGPSKAETSARDNDLENRDALGPDTKTISKILVKYSTLMPYDLYDKLSDKAPQVLKAKTSWWLKSPGDETGEVNCVMTDGSLQDKSAASKQGLRPVIEVIPEDFADDKLYAPVKALNGDWIKLSDKYLLLKEPAEQVAFDGINTLSNDFDKAAIKKTLDSWSEKYFKSVGAVFGSGSAEFQKELNRDRDEDAKKRESLRASIPEGMAIEALVEAMEENEDEVECKTCYNLFPKADCVKHDHGYVCATCSNPAIKPGIESEVIDSFNQNFPEVADYDVSDTEVGMAIANLVVDEFEAINGYEVVDEMVQHARIPEDKKVEIIDTLEHIRKEEEEHVDELKALTTSDKLTPPQEDGDGLKVELVEDQQEELSLAELVKDSINHLTNDLGKDPWADDFADDVIKDIENNYDIEVPEDILKYKDWCSSVACEVSRQVNNPDNLTEASIIPNSPMIGKKAKLVINGNDWSLTTLKNAIKSLKADSGISKNRINFIAKFDNMCTIMQETEKGYLVSIPCYFRDSKDHSKMNETPLHARVWVAKNQCNLLEEGLATNESELLEIDEVSDSHLKFCPECGKEAFDIETGICVECGFN